MYRAYKIASNAVNDLAISHSGFDRNQFNGDKQKMDQLLLGGLRKYIETASFEKSDLQAESIWDTWFPEVNADIFISHSSKDVDVANRLSIWLKSRFNLSSFIDSQIWGHSDSLLKEIDDKYCKNPSDSNYSYEKRNGSTAHIHMMLSYALTRMIDRTECVVFIESDKSISITGSINNTNSPWIFHELSTVDTIHPWNQRYKVKLANFSNDSGSIVEANESASLKVSYPIYGKRLIALQPSSLRDWAINWDKKTHPLDYLYARTPNPEPRGVK